MHKAAMAIMAAVMATSGATAAPASTGQPVKTSVRLGAFFPPDETVREVVRGYIDKREATGIVVGLIESDGSCRVLAVGEAGKAK